MFKIVPAFAFEAMAMDMGSVIATIVIIRDGC